MPPRSSLLASGRFRAYLAGRSVANLGDQISLIALPFAVLEISGSAAALGIVFAARTLPTVLLVLVGGVWGDRLSRRTVVIVTDLVRFGCQGIGALLLATGTAEIWHLVLLQAVFGAADAFFAPASTGLVAEVVDAPVLQEANAMLGIAQSATRVAGPALGGLLVVVFSPSAALAFDAMTFLVGAALIARLPVTGNVRVAASRAAFMAELREGWKEFTSRTWLWVLVLDFSIYQMAVLAPFVVLGPLIAAESLGGADSWGTVMACAGLGAVAGGAAALYLKPRRPLLVGTLLFFADIPQFVLLATAAPLGWLLAASVIAGGAASYFAAIYVSAMQTHVPADVLARVSSYDWFGSIAATPIGYAIVASIASVAGAEAILLTSAAIVLVTTLAVLAVPSVRHFPQA